MSYSRKIFFVLISIVFSGSQVQASDWDEDPATEQPKRIKRVVEAGPAPAAEEAEKPSEHKLQEGAPLQGVIKKTGTHPELQSGTARSDLPGALSGKAIDDELKGMVKDGSLKHLAPALGELSDPLKGRAARDGKELDPDEDDQELMVEWDRWRNRFLRAVQLGVQDLLNNPDPEDYERPRVDPVTGNFTSRYPLGTGAAFSCQVTADGQIKNLEIIEPSGFSKYDRALLRSVKALEGTRILAFPKGSHRRVVMQPGRIKTATTNQFQYHRFGDVERVPGAR